MANQFSFSTRTQVSRVRIRTTGRRKFSFNCLKFWKGKDSLMPANVSRSQKSRRRVISSGMPKHFSPLLPRRWWGRLILHRQAMEETEVLFCTFYFLGNNSLGKKGHRKTLGLYKERIQGHHAPRWESMLYSCRNGISASIAWTASHIWGYRDSSEEHQKCNFHFFPRACPACAAYVTATWVKGHQTGYPRREFLSRFALNTFWIRAFRTSVTLRAGNLSDASFSESQTTVAVPRNRIHMWHG